jgi:hypothetical protein
MVVMISILVLTVFLSGAGTAVFAMLVAGIHMDERHARRAAPSHPRRTRLEHATRRLLCAGMPINGPRRNAEGS